MRQQSMRADYGGSRFASQACKERIELAGDFCIGRRTLNSRNCLRPRSLGWLNSWRLDGQRFDIWRLK